MSLESFPIRKDIDLDHRKVLFEGAQFGADMDREAQSKLFQSLEFKTRVVLDGDPSTFDPEFLLYAYSLVRTIDTQLNAREGKYLEHQTTDAKKVKRAFSVKYSRETVSRYQSQYMGQLRETVAQFHDEHIPFVIAAPLFGAVPIAQEALRLGISSDHIVMAPIGGTVGTDTGSAHIQGELDPKLLDPDQTIVFTDDVMDSGGTLVQLALARREERFKKRAAYVNVAANMKLKSLPERIKEAHERLRGNDKSQAEEDAKIWTEAAMLLKDEQIILAPIYYKNAPLREAIMEVSNRPQIAQGDLQGNIRSKTQERMLAKDATFEVGIHEWIVGGMGGWKYPMMDTDVRGMDLMKNIPSKYFKKLHEWGFDRMKLRLFAGIKGLLVFNPDDDQSAMSTLQQTIADYVKRYGSMAQMNQAREILHDYFSPT